MRMIMQVSIPHDEFNEAVRDGTVAEKMKRILDETKPEAVYFTEYYGQRGAIMIIDLADPSKVPALAEPWFLTFNADVEFHIVMSPDELAKAGLDEIGKKWAQDSIHYVEAYDLFSHRRDGVLKVAITSSATPRFQRNK